jgi:cbb3-type cytochrome oxidase subunit 3
MWLHLVISFSQIVTGVKLLCYVYHILRISCICNIEGVFGVQHVLVFDTNMTKTHVVSFGYSLFQSITYDVDMSWSYLIFVHVLHRFLLCHELFILSPQGRKIGKIKI